jgi:hypothetical protein
VPDELAERLRAGMRSGDECDLDGAAVPAALLASLLTEPPPPGAPVLRLRGAELTGVLRLTGATVAVPVELRDCGFAHVPDLRTASFVLLALTGCRVPGVAADGIRVAADLLLDDGFTAHGRVHLTDAHVGGSLRLSGARLRGHAGRTLIADRLVVEGSCYARRLRSDGELRIPGARITGNLDLDGADLTGPLDALDATGASVGGSLLAGRHADVPDLAFTSSGRVLLAGARIGGDMVLSGARMARRPGVEPPEPVPEESRVPVVPGGIVDAAACLVADRVQVDGNLELDDDLVTDGTVRLPNARVGGYLRLSGARLAGPYGASDRGIALLGDGMEVGGDVEGRDHGRGGLRCAGQLRLVDAQVRGSASLSGVELDTPGGYALLGDRLRVGGDLYLRRVRCAGTIRLQNADVGATLDCTGAELVSPRLRLDGSARPSLDARAATIGKDLLCVGGFRADGGVRVRRTEAGKSVQIIDAVLGPPEGTVRYALNAHGLSTTELYVRPRTPPHGRVRLAQAVVRLFADSAVLWETADGVDLEDFDYASLADTRAVDVRTRLAWIERVVPDYAPGPYEQLVAVYRRAGDEELAQRVLLERQHRRYAEADRLERVWGFLQRVTVGYGYRPWLAVCWLAGFAVLGGAWFAVHVPPPLDDGQHPVFNPWIFAADTLLPIVNLGQDGYWRLEGASQWIAAALVAVGWILATTAAAGAARVLKRGA